MKGAADVENPAPEARTAASTPARSRSGLRIGRWTLPPGLLLSTVWLYFLHYAFTAALALDPLPRAVGLLLLVSFCVLYGVAFEVARRTRWAGGEVGRTRAALLLGLGVLLTLACCLLLGESGLSLSVYLAVMSVILLPMRWGLTGAVLVVLAVAVSTQIRNDWEESSGILSSIVLAAIAVWGIVQMVQRNRQLVSAQEEIAQLAVAAERTRFARDLHDLLGHSLTVITLKTELAGRLVRLAPERAEQEIAEVERLARDALADVRAAVAGYREVTLATEVVSARTALEAAGITADLPSALDEVPGERRELLGWAVREAVTNVVRHSGARHCRVTLTAVSVEVVDDGRGPSEGDTTGNGLRGLRERAEAAGARVSMGPGEGGRGFRLQVGW